MKTVISDLALVVFGVGVFVSAILSVILRRYLDIDRMEVREMVLKRRAPVIFKKEWFTAMGKMVLVVKRVALIAAIVSFAVLIAVRCVWK